MKIPIAKTWFDEADFAAVQQPLKNGWVVQGPHVRAFEEQFAAFTGSNEAIACTSCTTALHLALEAAGIGEGDEVIVPAFTWVATANAVVYTGARPVFCDIDLQTFNMDVTQVETLITPRTRAIIPVHLFGLAADMNAILAIAQRHRLIVIEDAACGFGTYYQDQHVGTFGTFGCFSFHPRKAISTGEGGMVVTRSPKAASWCRSLRDHGATKSNLSRHTSRSGFLLPAFNDLGYNYRMTDIQAALGLTQMEKANTILEQRRVRAARYDEQLAEVEGLQRPPQPSHGVHSYQSYVCLFAPEQPMLSSVDRLQEQRDHMMTALQEQGIATRQGTHAVTGLGFYTTQYGIRSADFPNAHMAERLSVALPLYPQMTDAEQDYVIAHVKRAMRDAVSLSTTLFYPLKHAS